MFCPILIFYVLMWAWFHLNSMLLHVVLVEFTKLLWSYFMELHYRVVTLGAQIGSKGTNGDNIIQSHFYV